MRVRFLALLLIVGGSVLAGSLVANAERADRSWADKALLEPDNAEAQLRVRGVVFDDLRKPTAADDPCAETFTLDDVLLDGAELCTHGPDPSPVGIDVQAQQPFASSTELATARAVPCEGNGVSGQRVRAIYAVAADRPDRYDEALPSIRHWAGEVDQVISDSARAHGGVRHARWVTNAQCELDVLRVVVPARGDDTFSATVASLKAAGHVRADRKYLIWMDASVYCGIATVLLDDRAAANNRNNGSKAMFGRVDSGCWGLGTSVEAHELVHTLGAVQLTAPNSSGGGHCTDEHDLLCYADAPGVKLTLECAAEWRRLLDCNGDDYFAINPPAGSYLATHWNTARSAFLSSTPVTTGPSSGFSSGTTSTLTPTTAAPTTTTPTTAAPTTPTPTTATPTTSAPTTTSTPAPVVTVPPVAPVAPVAEETFSGQLTRRNRSGVHNITIDAAADYRVVLEPSTQRRNQRPWRLIVLDGRGRLVDVARGSSALRIDHDLRTGNHRVIVLGGPGDYTVTIAQQ